MAVSKIKRKGVTLQLPMATYHSLHLLASTDNLTVPGYIKRLIAQHLYENGLPQYIMEPKIDASSASPHNGGEIPKRG